MASHQNPYLPPPPQDFLVPPSGFSPPPGLQPLPVQYTQLCPGLPRQVLFEHQQMMEKLQQLPQQQQEQQQQQHQQQQLQQQMLQQQLHRAHLELGAAHQRISKGGLSSPRLRLTCLTSSSWSSSSGNSGTSTISSYPRSLPMCWTFSSSEPFPSSPPILAPALRPALV